MSAGALFIRFFRSRAGWLSLLPVALSAALVSSPWKVPVAIAMGAVFVTPAIRRIASTATAERAAALPTSGPLTIFCFLRGIEPAPDAWRSGRLRVDEQVSWQPYWSIRRRWSDLPKPTAVRDARTVEASDTSGTGPKPGATALVHCSALSARFDLAVTAEYAGQLTERLRGLAG